MKKLTMLLLAGVMFFGMNLHAQCYTKKINKFYTKSIRSEDFKVKPEIVTLKKKIINKFSDAAIVSFVKADNNYYMFFFITRGNSSKFNIHDNNSIDLKFENGETVSLMPSGNFKAAKLPLLDCNIGCYYNVTIEQLKKIVDNGNLNGFILHISSDKEIPSAIVDKGGMQYFEYTINSENLKQNISEAAACILSN
ncbi:MAG: hypothetical protein A2W85_18185 [Bacteroidetes bacterium GWF2_41_31]|nr:MAG: hypothetical protein A2W85_18185 [Bacteroidetes bacterium GWF2_41_31]OFZ06588.1 MAG: hypothetical protein A2338_00865 [Bacteroidetes bacterium RIFOXYB12_FULL_41_6]